MGNEVQSNPNNTTSWTAKVKHLLEHSGFPDVWLFPESENIKLFYLFFKVDPEIFTSLNGNKV